MISPAEWDIIGHLKGRRALEHIENLCAFGDRFVGTEGDRKAMDYVRRHFEKCGLEIKETPITAPCFIEERPPALRIEATGETLTGLSPYLGPPTIRGGISAEVVDVGEGTDADFEGLDVGGKICLLLEKGLGYLKFWLGTLAQRAARRGAVGLIVIHPMPWPYRNSIEAGNSKVADRFCYPQLPAMTISAVEGAKLMYELGRGHTRVHLEVNTLIEERDSLIISGVKKGAEFPEERTAILGHRDTAVPPGANDNTSGTACVLTLAEVLSGRDSRRGFEFISTTAEDGATLGAYLYCQAHKEELQRNMKCLIDTDMISVGGQIKQVAKGLWPDADPVYATAWLMDLVDEVAEDLGYYFGRMEAAWGVAESARFLDIGVPSTWFWAPDDPYYHSTEDSLDKINPNSLKAVMDVSAVVMWRLAQQ
jgi:aminopeptidase YwaD